MSKQQRVTARNCLAALLLLSLILVSQAQTTGTPPPPAPQPSQTPRPITGETRQQALLRFLEARRLKGEAQRRRDNKQLIEQAIKAYRDTIWLDPQAAEPRVDLGELYFFFKNDLRSAEHEALEAIRLDNNCAGAHQLLARLSIAVLKFDNQNNAPNSQSLLDRATSEYEAVARLDPGNAEAWALLSELYRMKNDTAKQIQALERWASAPPPSDQAFYYWLSNSELTPDQAFSQLSQVYLSQGRKREALDAARRAYEFNPENNSYGRNLISALHAATKLDEELKLYARLSKTAPSPVLEIGYGAALIRAGHYQEAAEKLSEQVKGDNSNSSLLGLLATAQRRAGQRAAAAETLKAGIAKAEPNARISLQLELAETYEELGRNDEALAQYDQLLDALAGRGTVSEQNAGLYSHVVSKLARLCRRTGNQAKLQTVINRARRAIDEQNPLIEMLTIEALREDGKRREALGLTRAALRRARDDRGLRLTEVLILSELKNYKEAAELLRGLLSGRAEHAAEDANVYLILSNVQMQAGQLKEAEATARKALELSPGDSDALLQLGSVLDRADKRAEAEGILRELLDREPDNATALNNLGYLLVEREQKLNEAQTLIERAVSIEPLNGSFLDSLGWAYFKQGKLDQARAQLEKALGFARRNPTIHEHLGDVLLKLGKLAEARRAWEKALEYSLEADETARLKGKLRDAH